MKIISNEINFHIDKGITAAVAIGKFDGVHIGHQKLLEHILKQKQSGKIAVVFTFDSPPGVFFSGQALQELTTREEKRRLFQSMGIDLLIEFPLTKETAQIEPEDFLKDILQSQLHLSYIAAGADVSFGRNGAGDAKVLMEYGKKLGYQVEIIDKIMIDGQIVNSSYIREELKEGNVENVNKLLGRNYCIQGKVVHGIRLGRKMGVPTLNLELPEGKLLPRNGVYYSRVMVDNHVYKGITNVGLNPSVQREKNLNVETFLFDFTGEIYDKEVAVELLKYKRPEIRFDSITLLQEQLEKDITEGLQFHNICQ